MLRRPVTLLIACLLLLLPTLPAAAATFNPGCTGTTGDAAALQSAVTTAGSNSQADTITLTAGCTYTLTSTLTVNADSGNTLTINGNGATISGGNARRVLSTGFGAAVVISDVTITGGYNASSGGGIYNRGTITITNSRITGNTADLLGGGILQDSGPFSLTINNSTITGHYSCGIGACGIYIMGGTVTLNNSIIAYN
jgi:hypothetical protein